MAEATAKPNTIEPMTDDQLVSFCEEELGKSIGGNAGADSDADIATPLDYYLGRRPALSANRARDKQSSRYVSHDVMDGVESTVEEIMPVFGSGDIGFFEPMGQEDEQKAQSESDIVNYLFMEEYDGFTVLQTALKDALLNRNCSAKVFWDERTEVTYESFEDVPAPALMNLLTPQSENEQIELVSQDITQQANPEAQAALQGIQAQGGPQSPEDMAAAQALGDKAVDKFNITIKKMTKKGRPVIECIPPERVKVKSGHSSLYLHDCDFVADEMLVTESELIEMGFDPAVVAELGDYNADVIDGSRSRESQERDYTSSHRSMREIKVYDIYCRIDYDGDGIAERRRVLMSDDGTLLENEPFNSVSIIGGAIRLMPHKYKGISLYERLKDIQDAKTPVMRSIIDGVQLASNPRLGVITGKANIDDILTSRTGGLVRMERQDAVFEFPTPQIPQGSYAFLEFMDGVRRDRGGGSIDMSDQVNQMKGNAGDMGLERIMSGMELGSALLARNLGETFIRGIFLEMHNVLRENYPQGQQIQAKVGGRWISTVPSEWRKRTKVTIQVGASLAERARQSVALSEVIQEQEKLMQINSIMYDEGRHYAAMSDRAKLRGIRAPEKYFVDPQTPEGQKKSQFKQQMTKIAKEKEEAAQAKLVEAQDILSKAEALKAKAANDGNIVKQQNEQLKTQVDTLQIQLDSIKDDAELNFKYRKHADDLALRLTELQMEHNKPSKPAFEENEDAAE